MDKEGVAKAVLSLTTPGIWFGDARAATQTARRVNEFGADLVRRHPARFGLFAAIPLPDTETSLREIEYAFSALRTDGIGLMTSYDDKWLGEPIYRDSSRHDSGSDQPAFFRNHDYAAAGVASRARVSR